MGFQDVAFLPSRASLCATFLRNCDRGESHGTSSCPKVVAGGKHGHAPCNILLDLQGPFLCLSNLFVFLFVLDDLPVSRNSAGTPLGY